MATFKRQKHLFLDPRKKALAEKLQRKLQRAWDKTVKGNEVSFLKYLIDDCEHVLEDEEIIRTVQKARTNADGYHLVDPLLRELILLRIGISQRLERMYGIKYGKYAEGTDLLRKG